MRLLVLNHEFPPLGGGGGRAAEDICRALAGRGFEIRVLTSHLQGLAPVEARDGYEILRLRSLRTEPFRASLLSMAAYVLAGLWTGPRLIRRFRPDSIHAHFAVPAGALAWALSRLTHIPYVLTIHLGDVPGAVHEKTGTWFRWIYPFTRRIWRDAERIVAVSEFTKQLALNSYDADIQVIPNGIELSDLQPEDLQLNDPPRVVFAGRFMPQKNPVYVVQALSRIKDLPWGCVMIGDGPLMPDVRRAVSDSDLDGRIHLTGWIEPREVLDWLGRSDVLFMPSSSEGLPVVGVQALANGLAIVASQVGGFSELVDHNRNGCLISPGDVAGFATSLQDLLSNRPRLLFFRTASLEKARRFDLDRVVGEYEKIFESFSGGRQPG